MPNSSDSMFIDKLYEQILKKGHSHFTKPRTSRTSFGVRHYASTVLYETQGFTSKNTDLLSREHLKLLQSSQVMEQCYLSFYCVWDFLLCRMVLCQDCFLLLLKKEGKPM